MKTCFATVIYKQAGQYFNEYVASLESQTDQDFDILLINDNYTEEELDGLKIPEKAILADKSRLHLSIGTLRIELLKEAKERGYDLVIIGDADDTFGKNRVESLKKAYKMDNSYAFYYNSLVTSKGAEVFDFIPEITRGVRSIAQGNYLGMSTTAINIQLLSDDFIESLKQGDCNIFDWYLYSRILMDVGPGKYVEDAETIYRIHQDNQVGVTHDVQRELQVKLDHYKRLAETKFQGRDYSYFAKLLKQLQNTDISTLETETTNHNYWWSNIYMEENYEI